MKKVFPLLLLALGLVFVGSGVYAVTEGFEAKDQIRDELASQKITTPEDASVPNAAVDDPRTAESMADIIEVHALEATGGRTYAEMDREDPLRDVAFQASALRTSLYTSVMGFRVADLVIGLGAMIAVTGVALGGMGVALAGLVMPSFARKVHVIPVAAS